MLGLQPWRASLYAATAARRSLTTPAAPPSFDAMLDVLRGATAPEGQPATTDVDSPPTAGPDGYPIRTAPKSKEKKQSKLEPFGLNEFTIPEKPRYGLHVFSSRNNTITTFTKPQGGGVVTWFSAGSCGFKHAQRSTYEAGYQCAVRIFKAIEELAAKEPMQIDLYFKGFGMGRDAVYRALLTTEGENIRPLVASVTDRTPIKIGGTRSKKARRL